MKNKSETRKKAENIAHFTSKLSQLLSYIAFWEKQF